jgi:glycine/D-amino acid oxidase-like deaminating enzyme
LRVAVNDKYVRRIQHDIKLVQSLGIKGITWIDAEAVRARVNSARYLGAMWEPRLLLVDPARLVREEKRIAMTLGAEVYENSPVEAISRNGRFRLHTPGGGVSAEKLVFATNAYSHLFPMLANKQANAFTYMLATAPLTKAQLEPIGWQGGEGVEDARNLIHYYRITPDKRLVMGGGPVGLSYGNDLEADTSESAWRHLADHIVFLFPSLKGVQVTHRWGGPFSVTMDLAPALGYVGDPCAVYSLGCIGHGVSTSHLNAQVLRDLLLERRSDLLDCPFVNRRVIPWPPEPLRLAAARGIRAYLRAEDWMYERGME